MLNKILSITLFYLIIFFLLINTKSSHAEDISIVDFNIVKLKENSNIPLGWILKIWRGKPELKLIKEKDENVYRLRSKASAISIYKEIKLDVEKNRSSKDGFPSMTPAPSTGLGARCVGRTAP